MQSDKQDWALITGATFGIGEQLAAIFAEKKYNLILVARTESKLKILAEEWSKQFGVQVQVISADLAAKDAAANLYAEVKKRGLAVHVLVNNAGFGSLGEFVEDSIQNSTQMIQLNITALTELSYFFAKHMIASGRQGFILNVASVAGFLPGPLMAVYYATKAFVLHFSEAIHQEFKGKIQVTALCPGPTPTEFQKRAHIEQGGALLTTTSLQVAKDGVAALFSGKPVVIPGFFNKVVVFLVRLFPRFLVPKIMMAVQKNRT